MTGEPAAPAPFFTAPGEARPTRLLLVSYHFPPGTAVGGLRWQKFAAFAAERGWSLDVITLDPSQLKARDDRRLDALPPGTRVFGVARTTPAWQRAENRMRRWLRGAGGPGTVAAAGSAPSGSERPGSFTRSELRWWPRSLRDLVRARDAMRAFGNDGRWARDAAAVGGALARAQRYLACVTSGPPHMSHEAGRLLRARAGLLHVMDMRDPWSQVERVVEHVGSPIWYRLARRHERRAVAGASLVVMNTGPAAAAMRAAHPDAANRIIAVPNGFDDDERIPAVPRSRTFVIAYAGSVYLDRDPRPLLKAVARVVGERRLTPDDLRVEFMGEVEGKPVEAVADEEGVRAFVRWRPPAPRAAAMEFQAAASMLVCLYQDSRQAIPAKLYEYMLFDAWLLVFADPESGTGELLAGTEADVLRPGDLGGIATAIARRLDQHAAGMRPRRLAHDARFGRRARAEALFGAIERLRAGARAEAPFAARAPHF